MTSPVIIGDATLYLGDCREIIPMLSDIQCTVTSPPYNQLEIVADRKPSGIWADKAGGLGFVEAWKSNGYSDDVPETKYQSAQNEIFASIAQVSTPDASLFYNHQLRWRDGELLHPIQWFQPPGWSLRTEIIWDRAGGIMFNARMFCRFDERIIWFVRGKNWKWQQDSVGLGTIWRIPREQNKEHPVAFPEKLPWRCIAATTDIGDLVCDPYCGSGTTGAAAIKLGRRFVGIEKEQKFFELACRRIEKAYAQPDMFISSPAPKAVQEPLL